MLCAFAAASGVCWPQWGTPICQQQFNVAFLLRDWVLAEAGAVVSLV